MAKKYGEELLSKRLPVGVVGALENELERKLDLPRIVRSIAGGADFAEAGGVAGVGVVGGGGNRHDAVAAESGRVKVRVIGDVKDLHPELKLTLLVEREILKYGEIQAVETRPGNLGDAAQGTEIARADRSAGRGISKRSGVAEPAEFAIAVSEQPGFYRLTGKQSATS